jgi:ribosomal protein S12 methylthiotransferase accessory factor
MGVTRIADVTGLDRVGLPVTMAVRPNSRALAVAQGKGLDLDAAKASGAMEAVEAWHAENLILPVKFNTWNELRSTHSMIELDRLPPRRESRFHEDLRMLWIEGRNLYDGAPVWLPHQLVHGNYTLPPPPGTACFCASSNGLASGNHHLEALVHALCEVIERDAAAVWRAKPRAAREVARVDLESITEMDCLAVLGQLKAADMAVGIWDITSDVGIAAFHVEMIERSERLPPFFPLPSAGEGCHPASNVALLRALTEACQSRLTLISGSRDDLTTTGYSPPEDRLIMKRRQLAQPDNEPRPFSAAPDCKSEDFAADLAYILGRLKAVNITQVVMVELTHDELFGVPVVRVVVPGLETNPEHPFYTPGSRALRQAEASMWPRPE